MKLSEFTEFDTDPINTEDDDCLSDIYARHDELIDEGCDDGELDSILEALGYQ